MQIKDGDIFRKKCTAILASLLLIMICLIPVHAEEIQTENPSFEFELTANGEESIEATTGDIITVVLKLKRTDQNVPYTMYAVQDEIQYDSNFFELVQDGTTLKQGITSADIAGTDASREFYMNFLSMSGGSQWNATEQLGTIQLRVIGENGAAKIVSNDFLVSQKDGYGGYPCEANEVTVVVSTECTVKFESRGGDEIPSQQVQYGEKVAEPQSPSREGYLFQGWYSDIDLKEQWDFKDDVVKKNMTLYGSWKQGNLDEAETDEQPQKKSGAWIIIPLLVVAIFLLFLLLIRRKSRKNDSIR